MNLPDKVFYKVLGKVELNKINNEALNTYYIVQWNSQSGPITVQTRMSLVDHDDKIAEFEAKSTVNHFPHRSKKKSSSSLISSSEATMLIDILKQYDDRQNKIIGDSDNQKNFSKSNNLSTDIINSRMISSHSDVVINNKNGPNCNGLVCYNNKQDSISTDKNEINNVEKESSAQTSTTSVECGEEKRDEVITLMDSDNDSHYSVGDFTEEYRNSPDTYCDFSDLESTVVVDSYENWKLKWWNTIREDEKKSGGRRNWKTLEFISEIFRDSVHYFIGYDTETKFMTLIRDHEVPESEKKKVEAFKKFQNK